MKAFFFTLILKISSLLPVPVQIIVPGSLAPYVSFIERQELSDKDYILCLLNRYDIVVLCERKHNELTQYESLPDLFIRQI